MATAESATPEMYQAIACLQRLADAFERRRAQLASSVGLTEHQWAVLEEISSEHFMPSMFAKTRASTPAAVSKTIRQLVDRGLVSVSLSKSDGRQRNYVLTSQGKQAMAKLRHDRELAIRRIWLPLDRDRLRSFVAFGTALTERLEQYAGGLEDPDR
jgi:DNA-binding MarR family transcriptional regulator